MTDLERSNAELARRVVVEAGGSLTFGAYDEAMRHEHYFAPIAWSDGWGDPVLHRANCDKLCAFAAVREGLLVQTEEGYALP